MKRITKWFVLQVVFIANLATPAIVFSDIPKVVIAEIRADGHPQIEAVAYQIRNMLHDTFLKIRRYEVVKKDLTFSPEAPEQAFLEHDYVVFGAVLQDEREIIVTLGVYSLSQSAVVDRIERTMTSLFDLFDVADNAALDLISSFTGQAMEFGRFVFVNTGADAPYEVYIDGFLMGRYVTELEALVGEIEVVVYQEDRKETALRRQIQVEKGQTHTVEFELREPVGRRFGIVLLPGGNPYGENTVGLTGRVGIQVRFQNVSVGVHGLYHRIPGNIVDLHSIGAAAQLGYYLLEMDSLVLMPAVSVGLVYQTVFHSDLSNLAMFSCVEGSAILLFSKALGLGLNGGFHLYYGPELFYSPHIGLKLLWRVF